MNVEAYSIGTYDTINEAKDNYLKKRLISNYCSDVLLDTNSYKINWWD